MTDLTQLIQETIAFLAQNPAALIAGAAAKEVAAGVAKAVGSDIWTKIKTRLTQAGKAEIADAFAADPTKRGKQASLEGALHDLLEADPAFADELRQALAQTVTQTATQTGIGNTIIQNTGTIKIGN